MPLLKSLICFKGYDNGRRFLVISAACYGLFLMLSGLLLKAPVLLVLLLLLCSPVLFASGMRRVHDAGFATPIAALPLLIFWLCVFGITLMTASSAWLLMILGVLVTIALTILRKPGHRRQKSYQWGYSGPIDFSTEVAQTSSVGFERIEPTLAGARSEHSNSPVSEQSELRAEPDLFRNIPREEFVGASGESAQSDSEGNWQAQLQAWIGGNLKLFFSTMLGLSVLILALVFWPDSKGSDQVRQTEEQPKNALESRQRLNKVELPDNFWVMLDQYDALTIAWQGDEKADGELWSTETGKGDKGCVDIAFGNQLTFRSIRATIKNGGDYYVDFSPVDTAEIIQAIAKRSQFKLCGYSFSLKGTQAKLMVNRKYADYLE